MQPISIHRIWLLLQRNIIQKGRVFLTRGPLMALIFLIFAFFNSSGGTSQTNFFNSVFMILVVGLGFFQAASMMSEHKTSDGIQSSLTLPASDTEKFISAWLYSGPIFIVVFTVVYFILSWIITGLLAVFGITELPVFNPFEEGVLKNIKILVLIAQPLGLLAAITFNRHAAAKIIGSVIGLAIALGMLAILTVRIVYREAFEGFFTQVGQFNLDVDQLLVNTDSPLFLLLILGLTILASTYFKFQEKSV